MNSDDYLSFVCFIVAVGLTAVPGLKFRPGAWYRALRKPAWCPPNWVFGPVWLAIYLWIAVSGWLVWRQSAFDDALYALAFYAGQLVLNSLWSTIFFGLRQIGWALIEVLCLWLAILATIAAFYPLSAAAAFLFVPYAIWVAFAAVLNFSIWRLNPGRSS